jgi:hypothetical protein
LRKISEELHAVHHFLWPFAKRAQISFGDVAKGNLLTFEK